MRFIVKMIRIEDILKVQFMYYTEAVTKGVL